MNTTDAIATFTLASNYLGLDLTSKKEILQPKDDNTTGLFSNDSILSTLAPHAVRLSVIPPGCLINNQTFTYLPWNNPDSVVTLETTYLVWKILSAGPLPLLCATGLVVNVLNAIIFAKQGLRERINFMLFAVAIADFLVVAYNFTFAVELFVSVIRGSFQMFGPVVTFVTNNVIAWFYSFFYVSAFITTLVAVDRCICVTLPFAAKRLLKTKTTVVVVVVATVVLMGCHYVVADKWRLHCIYYPFLGAAIKTYHPSEFYASHTELVDVLNVVVYGVVLPVFFVLTTAIATFITAIQLNTAAAFRKEQGGQDKKEIAVTKMLIAVSCLFVACTIPNVAFRVVPLFRPDFNFGGRNQNMVTVFVAIVHMTSVINSSLNFFFYLKMGTKFRSTLFGLFSCLGRNSAGEGTSFKGSSVKGSSTVASFCSSVSST